MSPMVNIKVIAITKANRPFPLNDHNRAFGRVIDASWISSANKMFSVSSEHQQPPGCANGHYLLTHMNRTVVSDESSQRSLQSDKC